MKIEFDPAKRQSTLIERKLDMADAALVFSGEVLTVQDTRKDHGEPRFITIGHLAGRMVFVAWTPRGDARRIISMRKSNVKEQKIYGPHFS
jgi:uncharacterized DUF497 family protein